MKQNTFVNPFSAKKEMMPKILEMLAQAKEHKHKTFGTHGITPCLFPKNYLEENDGFHQLGSNCVPVFDFYPDNSVHYCFPLEGHNSIYDYQRFDNIQQIQSEFLWKASLARPRLFPWKECIGCSYAQDGSCHGGCMSNKPWLKEAYQELDEKVDIYEYTPSLTKPIEEILDYFPQFGWSKNLKKDFFPIHPKIWKDFLELVQQHKTLKEIKSTLDKNYQHDTHEWIQMSLYNLFGSLNMVFLPSKHERMKFHE